METAAAEPLLAASHSLVLEEHDTSSKLGKLCLDNGIEEIGTEMKANSATLTDNETSGKEKKRKSSYCGNYILTHL